MEIAPCSFDNCYTFLQSAEAVGVGGLQKRGPRVRNALNPLEVVPSKNSGPVFQKGRTVA